MNPVARLDTDRREHGRPTPARDDGAQGPAVRERSAAEEQIDYVTNRAPAAGIIQGPEI